MGISKSTVSWLRKNSYDVKHLSDENLQRSLDIDIIDKARRENRIILTCDLDFGYLMAISKEILPSIIIFRLVNEMPENINRRLKQVLEESEEVLNKGVIISVEETRYRTRFLPIS